MTYVDNETAQWAANLLGYRPRPQPYTEPATTMFVRPEWHARAACRGLPLEMWFPKRGEATTTQQAICAECPVRAECIQSAVDHGDRTGIWGGLTQDGMRRHRRRLALKRAA